MWNGVAPAARKTTLPIRHCKEGRENEKTVTHAVLKGFAAFLNTEGSLIGVADDRTIVGIEHDRKESDEPRARVPEVEGAGDIAGRRLLRPERPGDRQALTRERQGVHPDAFYCACAMTQETPFS